MTGGEDVEITDPLIWLAWVAARTTTIRLATGIVILPQRNPVILAKACATLDVLSGGRLELGVGVGWLREEFDALGVPFERRDARTDKYIQAMRALWTEDEPTYQGEFVSFDRAKCNPKPVQAGGPPIVIGGHGDAAAVRAGRLGDGFYPNSRDPEENRRLIALARATAVEHGRDPAAIEMTAFAKPNLDAVHVAQDIGVDRVLLMPPGYDAETLRRGFGEIAESLIAKV